MKLCKFNETNLDKISSFISNNANLVTSFNTIFSADLKNFFKSIISEKKQLSENLSLFYYEESNEIISLILFNGNGEIEYFGTIDPSDIDTNQNFILEVKKEIKTNTKSLFARTSELNIEFLNKIGFKSKNVIYKNKDESNYSNFLFLVESKI